MKTQPIVFRPAHARWWPNPGIRFVALVLLVAATAGVGCAAETRNQLRAEVQSAMKQAATFYRTKVATHGGYVYYYSLDLQARWGEGVGTADQIWVEPPGTPSVGLAYLEAYAATRDPYYLEAAKETGMALVYGQLQSGGWTQVIDFDPNGKHANRYRNGRGSGGNHSSLDDNQTQSAIAFLSRLDRALDFKDGAIHDAAKYALDGLLQAQFSIGAFPQGWSAPAPSHPILRASYPKEWPRLWPKEAYYKYYTLNDGLAGSVSDALLVALECYQDERYRQALARLGDFLLLAQMPEPQPAWAQQYNFEMQPTWARKFEPPAIAGLESEDAIRTLMKVYLATGDRKYLEPIPRALAYLRTCVLADGRMARYRELETNRALYMTRKPGVGSNSNAPGYYDFSYEDKNLPSHYGWKQDTVIDELAQQYAALQSAPTGARVTQFSTANGKLVSRLETGGAAPVTPIVALEKEVRRIVGELDAEGRWVSVYDSDRLIGQPDFKKGFKFIGSHVFNHNMEVLSRYLTATAPAAEN